jgi:hypothetical protein
MSVLSSNNYSRLGALAFVKVNKNGHVGIGYFLGIDKSVTWGDKVSWAERRRAV